MKYRVYVDTTKKRQDEQSPVVLIFEDSGMRFKISTGLFSSRKFTGKEFPKEEPNNKAKTLNLAKKLLDIDEYLLVNRGVPFNKAKDDIKAILNGEGNAMKPITFYMEELAKTKTPSTAKFYIKTARKIMEFDPSATFDTIDADWLQNFDTHMKENGNTTVNGRAIHLRDIKAVFNAALADEITTKYPFRKFKIKADSVPIKNITLEQLRELRDCKVEPNSRIYRDLFLLSFYLCGINPVDLLHLTNENVKNGRIVYTRSKTHKLYDIPLPPEAKEIFRMYRGKDYLLDVLDYYGDDYLHFLSRWNKMLKRIGNMKICERSDGRKVLRMGEPILPNLTVYSARYTFASIGAELEIPRETIALCLGHSWADVTAHYISYNMKRIDDAVRKIIDYVNADISNENDDI